MTTVFGRSLLAGLFVLMTTPSFGQEPSSGMGRGLMPGEVAGIPNEVWKRWADAKSLAAQRMIAIYDTNRDGKVSLDEWMAYHRKHLQGWDTDGDGAISRDEYIQGCVTDQIRQASSLQSMQPAGATQPETAGRLGGMPEQYAAQIKQQVQRMCDNGTNQFMVSDTEHTGKVTLAQAEVPYKAMFEAMDRNHDGFLTADEFQQTGTSDLMSRMPANMQEQARAQSQGNLVEVFHRGLEAEDHYASGDVSQIADFSQMVKSTEQLRQSGLTTAVSKLKDVIDAYAKRYPDTPSHHRRLRALLADLMINAGQLSAAEDILVDLTGRSTQPGDIDPESMALLQTYAKLLCKQNRSEECASYAQNGLARVQRTQALNTALNRATSPMGSSAFRLLLADAYMQQSRWGEAEQQLGLVVAQMAGTPFALPTPLLRSVVVFLKQEGRVTSTKTALDTLKRIASAIPSGKYNLLKMEVSLLDAVALFQEERYTESRDLALSLDAETLATVVGDRAAALRNYIVAAASRAGNAKHADLSASRAAVQLVSKTSNEGYSLFAQLLDVRLPIEENLLALGTLAAPDATNEAFTLIQRGTNNATAGAIAAVAARFATGQSDLAAVIRERQDLAYRRNAIRQQIFESHMRPSPNLLSNLGPSSETELPGLEKRLAVLDQDIAHRFPEYDELVRPAILSSNQAQALMHADQAIVSWFIGKEAGWAVVVRATGTKVVRLKVDPLTLRRSVSAVRKSVDLGPAGFVVFPAQKAYELYEALIAPVAGDLAGVKTLYIVPDSSLPSLPLSLLLTRKPSKSVINPDDTSTFASAPWLIRDYAISLVPTVSSLRSLQQLSKTADAPLSLFGIGDPLLADHPSLHNGKTTPKNSGALRAIPLRGVLADIGEIAKLPSLPETAGELTTIAAAFPESGAALNLREQATEARVKTEDLSRYRVLAFATHGLVAGDFHGLAEPGLVLTPPAAATSIDDGLLVASEVAGLKLNADWVVLSACNTGTDDNHSGSAGLGGLVKAFFYAGARTLMVSHWRVPSKATVELTTQTVTKSLNGRMGKAEAHRRAMLAMIASGSKDQSHPSAWAAFATVGLAD